MPADIDALNYPYIRVRDVDWLKRTLLIFPHVVRMIPRMGAPDDDPEISAFTKRSGQGKPLLRAANVDANHVHTAQIELIAELRQKLGDEGAMFRKRFGREATIAQRTTNSLGSTSAVWERRLSPNATFQIHAYKLFEELTQFLRTERLAWRPDSAYTDGPEYLEMHPQLGEAVMATLAMACAENEGLQVVTEFPKLHSKLLGIPREKILNACIDGVKPNGETSGQEIVEFLVYRHCNVDMLNVQNIIALKQAVEKGSEIPVLNLVCARSDSDTFREQNSFSTACKSERDALAEFRAEIEDLAKTLPPTIFSEVRRREVVDDLLSDMFRKWHRDQVNMSSLARKFFGDGFLKEPEKLIEKIVETAIDPQTRQNVISAVAAGSLSGASVLVSAGAGFVIALVFRGFENWSKAREVAKKSPLRYLTKLQDQGVTFSICR